MARQKNTKTHNIFLLNREKIEDIIPDSEHNDVEAIISTIMAQDSDYKKQELKPMPANCAFNAKLFFKNEPIPKNKLVSFCETFVVENQPILNFKNQNASSVLFVWSEN